MHFDLYDQSLISMINLSSVVSKVNFMCNKHVCIVHVNVEVKMLVDCFLKLT